MSEAVERLVNLALYLAAAREPKTAEQVRSEVMGYPEGQTETTFLRMFERDKEDLKRMGFAIEGDSEGLYRLDAAATYATGVELTPAEAAAVRAAGSALLGDPSFPFAEDLRLALAKISAEIDAAPVTSAAHLADEDPARQGLIVAELSSAASAHKRVKFGYTNASGASAPHTIEPYGLFLHDGRWYLVGRDVAKDEVRTYTVARMTQVEINAEKPKSPDFERPEDFDVAQFLRLPFQYGPVDSEFVAELHISADAAWRARALAAGQGELVEFEDGSVRWSVPTRSADRLARFAIENGPGIEVTGPPHLLERVSDGLAKVVELHG